MKTSKLVLAITTVGIASALSAQTPAPPAVGTKVMVEKGPHTRIVLRGDMGKWWRDPETAKKLQLNDGQVSQLDQIFYDHRVKLIDFGADMEKQDLKLQSLLDADQPNEGEVGSQVDQVLAARGKLEREYTFMNLDLRKVLSLDQWRTLKSIRGDAGTGDNIIYFKQKRIGPGAGMRAPLPPDFDVEAPPVPTDPTL
jgi:Spy/CpxP family protein refolding chaperone